MDSFNNKKKSYIEYRIREDNEKNLSLQFIIVWSHQKYLDVIIQYLRDLINDHEAPMKLIDY